MEQRKRTLIKTITWRLIAVLITMLTVLAFGIEVKQSLAISLVANGIKAFFYYAHERIWNQINYGRTTPEYHI